MQSPAHQPCRDRARGTERWRRPWSGSAENTRESQRSPWKSNSGITRNRSEIVIKASMKSRGISQRSPWKSSCGIAGALTSSVIVSLRKFIVPSTYEKHHFLYENHPFLYHNHRFWYENHLLHDQHETIRRVVDVALATQAICQRSSSSVNHKHPVRHPCNVAAVGIGCVVTQ